MTNKVPHFTGKFFSDDRLDRVWSKAKKYAGKDGRVATMLDIVDGRIASQQNDKIWTTYSISNSAEYFGISKSGIPLLIVAHGVGPMSNIKGVMKTFDRRSDTNGMCSITRQKFLKLENGSYGEVSIIDFKGLMKRRNGNSFTWLTASQACSEPLMWARLGSRAEEYIENHLRITRLLFRQKFKEQSFGDPTIVKMEEPNNSRYFTLNDYVFKEGKFASAYLLCTDGLMQYSDGLVDVAKTNVGLNEFISEARLVGIKTV